MHRLKDWIGRSETREEQLEPSRAEALRVTLESEDAPAEVGTALPELWHWAYFWDYAPLSELGHDGHAARGGFLPPVPLPRRMWAGSRFQWLAPLRLGDLVRKTSTIKSIEEKQGRSGQLVFVTVQHELAGPAGLAIREEHDIVYREAPMSGAPARSSGEAAPEGAWKRHLTPDPILLFRYSALTFNGHRIHYDQPYVTGEEGYPGLVVHGPLLATLMVDLARRSVPEKRLLSFQFQAIRPVFCGEKILVGGEPDDRGADLWVADPEGALCMRGRVNW
ncbi:MAG TPA: MaoC family dehydratase N-terminal domain-containing protein [Kiloniellales bacterium]|mgnify:FL=1|jgi:3-methylfumaryl-CoA hydratase|nr:MaoC family dehydratase N-terminal domain-containing protein [Kiloniellales bacterium]